MLSYNIDFKNYILIESALLDLFRHSSLSHDILVYKWENVSKISWHF